MRDSSPGVQAPPELGIAGTSRIRDCRQKKVAEFAEEFAEFAPGIRRARAHGPGPLGPGQWAGAHGPGPMGVEKKSRKSRETKSSQNGVCLVGKLSGHLGRVFLDYLEAPSSHIRQNIFGDGFITKFN